MGRKSPEDPIQEKSGFREKVDLSFTSIVSAHAGAYRLTLPKKEAEFWGIEPGDEVHVIVDLHKGERSQNTGS